MSQNSRRRRERRPDDDPAQHDRAWADYSQSFREQIMPELLSSALFVAIYDSEGDAQIKFATELGLMLLHNKPIVLCVTPGQVLPERLARVADELVEVDHNDPASMDAFAAAVGRVRARLDADSEPG